MTAAEVLPMTEGVVEKPKRRLPASLRLIARLVHTIYLQRIKGFAVSDMPHFDTESTPYFVKRLSNASTFLEYGAGGSSVLAARMGKSFVSVDSDPYFLRAVQKKILDLGLDGGGANRHFKYINIGLTERWGVPVSTRLTPRRLAAWRAYFSSPWQQGDFQPDLILVDGRFRVGCALTTILHLADKNSWTILFDDYQGRPHYAVVEQFASLEAMVGRMAVFTPKQGIDLNALRECLDQHASDWR
jgi:hypothetical protein